MLSTGNKFYEVQRSLGQRVSQEVSSVVTEYLLDTQPGLYKVLAATKEGNTTRYIHGATGIHSQQNPTDEWLFFVQDGLGSVRGVYDASLTEVEYRNYDPYGNLLAGTADESVFGYTGEPFDDNGLLHLRARYYDSVLGSFLNLDPLETDNRYGYVGANPANAVDPSGMLGQADIGISHKFDACKHQAPRDCACYVDYYYLKMSTGETPFEACATGTITDCQPIHTPAKCGRDIPEVQSSVLLVSHRRDEYGVSLGVLGYSDGEIGIWTHDHFAPEIRETAPNYLGTPVPFPRKPSDNIPVLQEQLPITTVQGIYNTALLYVAEEFAIRVAPDALTAGSLFFRPDHVDPMFSFQGNFELSDIGNPVNTSNLSRAAVGTVGTVVTYVFYPNDNRDAEVTGLCTAKGIVVGVEDRGLVAADQLVVVVDSLNETSLGDSGGGAFIDGRPIAVIHASGTNGNGYSTIQFGPLLDIK